MQITIKKLDGQKENFNFDKTDEVSKVKEALAEKAGIASQQIRLIFKGHPMVDTETLEKQGVTAGSTIHMIMQMRG